MPDYTSQQKFGKSFGIDKLWGLIDLSEATQLTGLGRHIFPSGNVYEGMFQNDKRNGYGRLIWSDGAYYEGEWLADKRNGLGCFCHSNGTRNEGIWNDGKLQNDEESFMSIADE